MIIESDIFATTSGTVFGLHTLNTVAAAALNRVVEPLHSMQVRYKVLLP